MRAVGRRRTERWTDESWIRSRLPSACAVTLLLGALVGALFVPVIACIGVGRYGRLCNGIADVFAGHLAAKLGARRLVIAGTTPGVLGADGTTVPVLDPAATAQLMADGTATAGMLAKLRACQDALASGVEDVVIVDGRDPDALTMAAGAGLPAGATRLVGQHSSLTGSRT